MVVGPCPGKSVTSSPSVQIRWRIEFNRVWWSPRGKSVLPMEPWKITSGEPRYLPVQAEVGDFAIFFRKAAVEITFEGEKYLVVPQAAILGLVRQEGVDVDDAEEEEIGEET